MNTYDDGNYRTMSDVLDKYGGIADEIELLSMYCYSKVDDGFAPITKKEYAESVVKDNGQIKDCFLRRIFESPRHGLRSKFDDFEDFYSWVSDFQNELARLKSAPEQDVSMIDSFYEAKWKEIDVSPELLSWINTQGLQQSWKDDYKRRIEMTLPAYICGELNEPGNSELKEAFISVRLAHAWHCTLCGMAERLFRFRLTDGVKDWLRRYDSVFDLKGFEDLAFYKGDRILYSSCTHEGFDNDYI